MKKSSLMGASVVAAALLAAAPVVAPVASLATPGTQVVKADTTKSQAVANYVNKLIGTLKGSNSDDNPSLLTGPDYVATDFTPPTNQSHANNDTTASLNTGFYETGVHLNSEGRSAKFNNSAIQGNATVSNNDITVNGSTVNEYALATDNVKYSLTYTVNYGDGRGDIQKYDTSELAAAVNDLKTNGGSLTAHYQFYDTYTNASLGSANPVVTFKPQSLSKKALFVTVNDVTVPNGTSGTVFNSRGSVADNGGKVLNEKGENIISSLNIDQFKVGNLKYDLVAGRGSGDLVNADDLNKLPEGTYTQEIKFNLRGIFGADDDGGDKNVTAADNAGRISINGHSFADILAGKVVGMTYDGSTGTSDDNKGYVTIIRKVTVGKPGVTDAPYTAEKVDGVVTVTTKEGTAAQVYDQAGNPVYSRALAPGSRWVTGQKRTLLKNGKVYYQVSTNEFLSADDVSYAAKSASSSEHLKGAVKVTQIGKKVFTVADGNYGYVWAKDDDNNGMHLVKSRFLAPNSKWQSGAKANMTDSDGNTHEFYQVSTNEWIDGSVGSIN